MWRSDETVESYVKKFLVIGTLENLEGYLQKLSILFSLNVSRCEKLNVSNYETDFLDLKYKLNKAHPRDFELFCYVNSL